LVYFVALYDMQMNEMHKKKVKTLPSIEKIAKGNLVVTM